MKKQNAGFTLIELVVVIVILGILAATAVPRFANLTAQANIAVAEGVQGAIMSTSVIRFGETQTTNTFANLLANTDISADFVPTYSVATCNTGADTAFTVTYDGSTSGSKDLAAALCSG